MTNLKKDQKRLWKMWHLHFPVGISPYIEVLAPTQSQMQGLAPGLPSLWCEVGVWLQPLRATWALCPWAGVCGLLAVGRETEPQGALLQGLIPFASQYKALMKGVGRLTHRGHFLNGLKVAFPPSSLWIPQDGNGSVAPDWRGDAQSPTTQRRLSFC